MKHERCWPAPRVARYFPAQVITTFKPWSHPMWKDQNRPHFTEKETELSQGTE